MAYWIELPTFADERGTLTAIDGILPFQLRRVYYIYNLRADRGGHRHHRTIQCLISLSGSCMVQVNNGTEESMYKLDRPDHGLLVEPEDWHTMGTFTPDCVLLVLASHPYDRADYIEEPY